QERARERGVDADVAEPRVDLVGADDAIATRLAVRGLELEPGAEEDRGPVARALVHDAQRLEALAEVAHAPVDLAELLLAVDVLGVLGAVALGGRGAQGLHDFRPAMLPKVVELGLEPRMPFPGDQRGARCGRWP